MAQLLPLVERSHVHEGRTPRCRIVQSGDQRGPDARLLRGEDKSPASSMLPTVTVTGSEAGVLRVGRFDPYLVLVVAVDVGGVLEVRCRSESEHTVVEGEVVAVRACERLPDGRAAFGSVAV